MSRQHCRNIVGDWASEWEDRDQHGALIDPVITPRSQTAYKQNSPRETETDVLSTQITAARVSTTEQPGMISLLWHPHPDSVQTTLKQPVLGMSPVPDLPQSACTHTSLRSEQSPNCLQGVRTTAQVKRKTQTTNPAAQLSTHTTALGELGSPPVGRGDKTAEISTTVQDKSPADCHARRRRQPVAGAWWQGPHDRSLPASAPQPGRRARRARPRGSSHRAVAQQPSMKWSKRGAGSSTRPTRHKARYAQRPKELCEIRRANYPAPFRNSLYGLCGTEPKSFVKEEVAVFGSPSLILRRVCVDVKQHWTESHLQQVLSEQRDRRWCDANSTR